MKPTIRKPYPSDVSDEALFRGVSRVEWAFVMPYLTLLPLDARQRKYDLREVFNALRWLVRTGAQWEYLPHDFPPPQIVSEQARRWMNRGVFEDLVHDLRETLRLLQGRAAQPSEPSMMVEPCNQVLRAVSEQVMTGLRSAKGARCTWP